MYYCTLNSSAEHPRGLELHHLCCEVVRKILGTSLAGDSLPVPNASEMVQKLSGGKYHF